MHPPYVRINDFVSRMAQTPRGVVVKPATIHTSTIQDVFLAVQSKGASFASGRFRDFTP